MTQPRPRESERRLRHNFRLARLLQFLELVSGRGRWNPKSLMAELEVSERTIHRLRETLELAGVPITFDKDENAYRVRADYQFPPINLTTDEAIAQATATALSESDALKLPRGSKPTTRKLAEGGSEQIRRTLDDATQLTEVLDLKLADHPHQRDTIATIQRSLVERKRLTGIYRSPYEAGPVTLDLHPFRIALVKQAWYLIARPEREDQPRTYRIVRFQSLRMTDQAATVPNDFDLTAYFGNAWAVFRGDQSYDIELRFTRDAADTVCEHPWHHTQQTKTHPNGEVTLTFTVDGLNEILRWVVGWAGRVRVVKPSELRTLVVEQHQKAIAINQQTS